MRSLWTCPHCGRIFRRAHPPHSCGVGSRKGLLEGKPEPLVKLYLVLEKILKGVWRLWRGAMLDERQDLDGPGEESLTAWIETSTSR